MMTTIHQSIAFLLDARLIQKAQEVDHDDKQKQPLAAADRPTALISSVARTFVSVRLVQQQNKNRTGSGRSSHSGRRCSIVGAAAFHDRVRDGNGWCRGALGHQYGFWVLRIQLWVAP